MGLFKRGYTCDFCRSMLHRQISAFECSEPRITLEYAHLLGCVQSLFCEGHGDFGQRWFRKYFRIQQSARVQCEALTCYYANPSYEDLELIRLPIMKACLGILGMSVQSHPGY